MTRPYPAEPVLVVDDESMIRKSLRSALLLDGITNIAECEDGDSARALVRVTSFAAIILDLVMPGVSGTDLVELVVQERPESPVIVATGAGDVDIAVRCMRAGAFDYIAKPIEGTRLVTSVRHAIKKWETDREVKSLAGGMLSTHLDHPEAFANIVTRDPAMMAVFKYVEAVAPTSLPVFVTGETGVGKELFARAVHSLSRRNWSFVPVNVAGLDDTLFADSLFGHVKGAYTGADSAREGMVAKAEGGTLFLDEIGDLAPASQIKLLRLLQEREYYPLGTDSPRKTGARFVFATNLAIEKPDEAVKLRKDLLHRLRAHHFRIPPLRERPGDLGMLVDHFIEKSCQVLGKNPPRVPQEIVPLLKTYSFPGNVRELEGMIFDAMVRHQSRTLSLESFRAAIAERTGTLKTTADWGTETGDNIFSSCPILPTPKEAIRMLIGEALRRSDDNQTIAAEQLGMTRSALNRRMSRNL
jgi:two-component system, NtrC family, nitrogen regulation response regulator GlnG